MASSINIKVQHESGEIRLFPVRTPSYTNYNAFYEEMQNRFSDLRKKNFNIYWRDNVGDNIRIATDDELQMAIEKMRSSLLYVFYIRIVDHKEQSAKVDDPEAQYHNCICDNCDVVIQNFRYKCMQCDDFDLCSKCEAQGIHPVHFMIRVPSPTNWAHEAHQVLRKFIKQTASIASREHSHGRHRHHHQKRRCTVGQGDSFYNGHSFKKFLKKNCGMFAVNLDELLDAMNLDGKENSPSFLVDLQTILEQTLFPDKNETAKKDESTEVPPKAEQKSQADNAQNIDTDSESAACSCNDTGNEKPESIDEWMIIDDKENTASDKNTTSDKNIPLDKKVPVDEKVSLKTEMDEEMISSEEKVKTPEEAPTTETTIPAQNQTEKDTPQTAHSNGQNLYPSLQNSNRIFHTNPKIQAAIEAMIAMGFSNKGGLLTYLLDAENGNISKVLDLLQPSDSP